MVNFYKKRIIAGKMLWTGVPEMWLENVKAALEADGYTCNEDGTVTKNDPNKE